MMKLGQWGRRFLVPRLFSQDSTAAATRVLFFSTETLTSSSSSRSWSCFEKRVSLIKDPKVSIIPYLNEWFEKGGKYDKFELSKLADRMHQRKRYQHAFEVSRWMVDPEYITTLLTPEEIAVRLDFIYKIHGLEHAERYFSSMPLFQQTRNEPCRALLHCYVEEKSLEKAETFVQKMDKLGVVRTDNFYQLLSILYIQTGQHEKKRILSHEMESNDDIPPDEITMIDELIIAGLSNDVGWMEKVFDKMEKDPEFYVDWTVYAIMADGYVKAGPGLIDIKDKPTTKSKPK